MKIGFTFFIFGVQMTLPQMSEKQRKVYDLIVKNKDKGTLVKEAASEIKDTIGVGRCVCRMLEQKGLVVKKKIPMSVSSERRFNNIRTQKLAVYFPKEG